MKAIRIHEHGGAEVLRYEDTDLPDPGTDEVRVTHTSVAVNYSDINVRRGGFYPVSPQMPVILGNEAAGVVTALGAEVTGVAVGDRVGYAGSGSEFFVHTGAYAAERNISADRLVPLPESMSDDHAASVMMKGLTAATIIRGVRAPLPGETVLVHAAASGVGLVLAQWAVHLGATVIGTVGSKAKADVAREHGVEHCVLYREVDFREAVRELRPRGVDLVYDGVGADTFLPSLEVVRPFGTIVNYGNASGPVPPLDLFQLASRGSLSVSRVGVELRDLDFYRSSMAEVFDLVSSGAVRVHTGQTFDLRDARLAHEILEAGRTAGSTVLHV